MDLEFNKGDVYEWCWTINGRVVGVRATFTGEGKDVDGTEYGWFKNVDTGKKYLLSGEGYLAMQATPWDETKEVWKP